MVVSGLSRIYRGGRAVVTRLKFFPDAFTLGPILRLRLRLRRRTDGRRHGPTGLTVPSNQRVTSVYLRHVPP